MKRLTALIVASALSISSMTVFAATNVPATKKTSIYTMSEVLKLVSTGYTGDIVKIDLETNKNSVYYEIDMLNNGKKTELIVDAKTGKVTKTLDEVLDDDEKYIVDNLKQDTTLKGLPAIVTKTTTTDKNAQTVISKEKAQQIALEKVGSGEVVKSKVDYDDKTVEYEMVVTSGKYKHEIDIDAHTGAIVGYEKNHMYD